MRRYLNAIAILVMGLTLSSPVFFSKTASAIECFNGSTPGAGGTTCVCPDGNPAQGDGSCSTDPFAQACLNGGSAASSCQNDPTQNPVSGSNGVIFKAINIFSFIIGAASVIMVLVGGLKYVVAAGDSNGIATAKNTILYAIIGVVVFILSRAIIVFVVNKL